MEAASLNRVEVRVRKLSHGATLLQMKRAELRKGIERAEGRIRHKGESFKKVTSKVGEVGKLDLSPREKFEKAKLHASKLSKLRVEQKELLGALKSQKKEDLKISKELGQIAEKISTLTKTKKAISQNIRMRIESAELEQAAQTIRLFRAETDLSETSDKLEFLELRGIDPQAYEAQSSEVDAIQVIGDLVSENSFESGQGLQSGENSQSFESIELGNEQGKTSNGRDRLLAEFKDQIDKVQCWSDSEESGVSLTFQLSSGEKVAIKVLGGKGEAIRVELVPEAGMPQSKLWPQRSKILGALREAGVDVSEVVIGRLRRR